MQSRERDGERCCEPHSTLIFGNKPKLLNSVGMLLAIGGAIFYRAATSVACGSRAASYVPASPASAGRCGLSLPGSPAVTAEQPGNPESTPVHCCRRPAGRFSHRAHPWATGPFGHSGTLQRVSLSVERSALECEGQVRSAQPSRCRVKEFGLKWSGVSGAVAFTFAAGPVPGMVRRRAKARHGTARYRPLAPISACQAVRAGSTRRRPVGTWAWSSEANQCSRLSR